MTSPGALSAATVDRRYPGPSRHRRSRPDGWPRSGRHRPRPVGATARQRRHLPCRLTTPRPHRRSAVGFECEQQEPSGRKAALDSPFADLVRRRAGDGPAVSSAHNDVTNVPPSSSRWATEATSRSPLGERARAPILGMDTKAVGDSNGFSTRASGWVARRVDPSPARHHGQARSVALGDREWSRCRSPQAAQR